MPSLFRRRAHGGYAPQIPEEGISVNIAPSIGFSPSASPPSPWDGASISTGYTTRDGSALEASGYNTAMDNYSNIITSYSSMDKTNPSCPPEYQSIVTEHKKYPPLPTALKNLFQGSPKAYIADPCSGDPLGWGYLPKRDLSNEEWMQAAEYGSWEPCPSGGNWILVIRWASLEEAMDRHDTRDYEITREADGSFRNLKFFKTNPDGKKVCIRTYVIELHLRYPEPTAASRTTPVSL